MKFLILQMLVWLSVLSVSVAAGEVTIFQEGSSLFSMGLSDGDNIILPAEYWIEEYDSTFHFSAGRNGPYGFYDKESGCLHPAEYDYLNDYFTTDPNAPILAGKNGYYGYICRDKCEIAIPFIYQSYGEFSAFEDGYAIIGKGAFTLAGGSEFVLIDSCGTEILFEGGYEPYLLPQDGYVVLIDPDTRLLGLGTVNGKVVVQPVYEGFGRISEGYASYLLDGKWGHMTTSGEIILPPTYELYFDFEEPYCPWGYYFVDGIATLLLATEDESAKVIYIDHDGEFVPLHHDSDVNSTVR